MKKLIAEIIIYLIGMGCAITTQPENNTEWAIISYPDGTEIQGDVAYRWEQNGMEHVVFMNGEEYTIELEYVDFH